MEQETQKRIHISDLANSMRLYLDNMEVTVGSLNMPLEKLNQVVIKSTEIVDEAPVEILIKDEITDEQKQVCYLKEINKLNSRKIKSFITTNRLEEKTIADVLGISVGTFHNYANNSCLIPVKKLKIMNEKFSLGLEVVERNKRSEVHA